jgi:hypothetical protein
MDNQKPSPQEAQPTSNLPAVKIAKSGNTQPAQAATADQLKQVEKEMNAFERATLRWAKVAVLLSGLAALFVCAQWYEMHTGGQDTHDLAEAAKTQSTQAIAQTAKMGEAIAKQDALIAQTTAQALATNRLASEAKRSADLTQSQQIPWLGIEQPGSMPVRFSYLWREPLPYPTINVDVRFSVKNYGPSPAHLVPYQVSTLILDTTPENDSKSLRKTCGIDVYRTGQVTLPQDPGEVLVPGATRPFNYVIVTSFGGNTPKEFKTLSFTACMLYQDAARTWHFSGYRYGATGTKTVKVPGHSGWSYVEFVEGSLLASDAE